jgi:AraC family transcriptional regulator of adaptative response/methylated-DNA-[protein]-cysteine methyltransferase
MNEDAQPAYHYALIARALREIDASAAPLSLDALAARLSMSPAHFQRVFSAWVGVSPKRYQQYLTLNHARDLLDRRHSMLTTAQEAGLSGAGRLHDLFLTWEAMSPGQYAARGLGLTIRWGLVASRFGQTLVMATDRGVCGMGFADEMGLDWTVQDLMTRWPQASFLRDDATVEPLAQQVLGGGAAHLHLIGAPFQIKVWQALMQVPSGHVTTYSDIAARIGHPNAVRAVGTAVGRNPISLLIPCHRALRKDGALGGYHWGLPVKRAVLAWESARLDAAE